MNLVCSSDQRCYLEASDIVTRGLLIPSSVLMVSGVLVGIGAVAAKRFGNPECSRYLQKASLQTLDLSTRVSLVVQREHIWISVALCTAGFVSGPTAAWMILNLAAQYKIQEMFTNNPDWIENEQLHFF